MLDTNDPDYPNYIGLRHLSPDMVRTLRAGLDNKADPNGFYRKMKRERKSQSNDPEALKLIEVAEGALRFMVRNPEAGKVRWTEGEEYVFVDTD